MVALAFADALDLTCHMCGSPQLADSTTDICPVCGQTWNGPSQFELDEQEEVMRQGELEIYRLIRRGELP